MSYVDSTNTRVAAGRIAVAKFPNPAGLQAVADNLFTTTPNSGDFNGSSSNNTAPFAAGVASWGAPLENGRGKVLMNQIEMSNVDLAQEFTNMITAQRGFQANSRVISSSDEMLQDLVNLKR